MEEAEEADSRLREMERVRRGGDADSPNVAREGVDGSLKSTSGLDKDVNGVDDGGVVRRDVGATEGVSFSSTSDDSDRERPMEPRPNRGDARRGVGAGGKATE